MASRMRPISIPERTSNWPLVARRVVMSGEVTKTEIGPLARRTQGQITVGRMSAERLRDDFRNVLGQTVGIADALECGARIVLSGTIEPAPAVEAARHARRHLRIEGIDGDHLVGEELIAGAVGGMEAHVVADEGADERVHLVRNLDVERRMLEQGFDSFFPPRPRRRAPPPPDS